MTLDRPQLPFFHSSFQCPAKRKIGLPPFPGREIAAHLRLYLVDRAYIPRISHSFQERAYCQVSTRTRIPHPDLDDLSNIRGFKSSTVDDPAVTHHSKKIPENVCLSVHHPVVEVHRGRRDPVTVDLAAESALHARVCSFVVLFIPCHRNLRSPDPGSSPGREYYLCPHEIKIAIVTLAFSLRNQENREKPRDSLPGPCTQMKMEQSPIRDELTPGIGIGIAPLASCKSP